MIKTTREEVIEWLHKEETKHIFPEDNKLYDEWCRSKDKRNYRIFLGEKSISIAINKTLDAIDLDKKLREHQNECADYFNKQENICGVCIYLNDLKQSIKKLRER